MMSILVRMALRVIISGFGGYEVVGETGNGSEAIYLAKTLSPDIVFMDVILYGIDGLEVSEVIKKTTLTRLSLLLLLVTLLNLPREQ